jgi:uncharacterized membrane protein YphA (DoxX/SURF4 family)
MVTLARALPWLGVLLRVVLGGVFLWAGGSKVGDLAGSVRAVSAYQILPFDVSTAVGSMLPFAEVVIGVLLIAGFATRLAGVVSAALLGVFIAGITSAWARGLSIDCGCFGGGGALAAGESPQYVSELVRDGALLVAAALLVWRPATPWSVDGWLARDDPPDHGRRDQHGRKTSQHNQIEREAAR